MSLSFIPFIIIPILYEQKALTAYKNIDRRGVRPYAPTESLNEPIELVDSPTGLTPRRGARPCAPTFDFIFKKNWYKWPTLCIQIT
jgi:hypothetical protein